MPVRFRLRAPTVGDSSNGRTVDFDSTYGSSNLSSPTKNRINICPREGAFLLSCSKTIYYMKYRVTFDFHFLDELTEQEIENLIYIIESWSEHEGGAFLEIPGGFKNLLISRKMIKKD